MTAPEYIWAWTWNHKFPSKQNGTTQWNASIYPSDPDHCATEYRRADLPPTLEQALALPEIKALVEALRDTTQVLSQCLFQTIFVRGQYIDRKELVTAARAALSAIGEGGE